MDAKRLDVNKYQIQFAYDEMIIITNCLNEVCNGIDVHEFSTRIGAERARVENILDGLLDISRELPV
jgi:hypothetical protein